MAGSRSNPEQREEEVFSEMEDEEFDSDDSEEDPPYIDDLAKTQSKFSKLTINNKSNLRDDKQSEVDDDVGMSSVKLNKEDMKDFEQVQEMINCGKLEKLKVEQCKVYLRKNGLRLSGKKNILIQRIKEHIEIVNGGGEVRYPPSSFVLNCKGDACLGDIVMFEQTVYEGYSIASRSATGPPCGKRTIAGRIVNESYGAAKQQHTFTVEVLWSKGDKPLPPLHPLLIKGRNLYKLETRRQKWEDEAERQRVLSEKHSRGSVVRSNREARVQEKMARKPLKRIGVNSKNKENSCHQKDSRRAMDQIYLTGSENLGCRNSLQQGAKKTQVQKTRQDSIPEVPIHLKQAKDTKCSHSRHLKTSSKEDPGFIGNFQSKRPETGYQRNADYKANSGLPLPKPPLHHQNRSTIHYNSGLPPPRSYSQEQGNSMSSSLGVLPFPDNRARHYSIHPLHDPKAAMPYNFQNRNLLTTEMTANCKPLTDPWQRPSQRQQLCPYYPQGRCYYGNRCKFLHESNRNHC